MKRNLITLITAAVLIIIFVLLLFTFQVRYSEVAVVTTFGGSRALRANRDCTCAGRGRFRTSISSTNAPRTSRTSSVKT